VATDILGIGLLAGASSPTGDPVRARLRVDGSPFSALDLFLDLGSGPPSVGEADSSPFDALVAGPFEVMLDWLHGDALIGHHLGGALEVAASSAASATSRASSPGHEPSPRPRSRSRAWRATACRSMAEWRTVIDQIDEFTSTTPISTEDALYR
jgi:hypothetical protein